MTEVEAIRERHSVRNYQKKKIESEKIELLNEKIKEINEEGNLHFQLIEEAGNTFNKLLNKFMGLGSAPSVIACVGKEANDLDERVGYYGQKLVLYAQQLGLNTCWAGTYNPKNVTAVIEQDERLAIVIAIGYGENPGRNRKSKTPDQVAVCKGEKPAWLDFAVEMALLAPTAVNQQKFEIICEEDGSVQIKDKGGILSKIDLGIVKYNFEVGKNNWEN